MRQIETRPAQACQRALRARRSGAITMLLTFSAPLCLTAQAASSQPLLGSVDNAAFALTAFGWSGTDWEVRDPRETIPEGTPVMVVDSLGRSYSASIGRSTPALGWLVRLVGAEELRDAEPYMAPEPVGFFSSTDVAHAPVLRVPSPLSHDEWNALLAATEYSSQGLPSQLDVRVWNAAVADHSLTYFVLQEATGCPMQVTGWVPAPGSGPLVLTHSRGDCEGKGLVRRRPLGLAVLGDRPALLIGYSDWDSTGVELWTITNGQLQMQYRVSPN